ncbi:hypothetical protein CAPTEDRAFT_224976 [Capitella teleta]|uniref:PH domain-containing protein n=1 Tax=Capitella teleta TaxID=283909 RepID=R7UKF9_CAPTE|nr:hypothetical protein CAPTEDRAFT_224976 [Capitella teleta]|eukprot:ELU07024.1 hypothetical protein CAPTEDRAFT_224976 [Capitella teleta]
MSTASCADDRGLTDYASVALWKYFYSIQREIYLVPGMDQYLQQKIEHEIKMRDGTAKLLAASKHPHQMLEAAKNLLTSNARMISYMTELQKRKTDQVMKRQRSSDGDQVPCNAKVSISDIRVPLMWRDVDHFKNKGDHRRFAMFCLVKIGTEVHDTCLVKEVDRTMTDLVFPDIIVFNDINPDFKCHIEVYAHKLFDDLSIASTPSKIKKKINDISSSVGRSLGRRLSGMRDEPEFMPNMLLGPKFECIAHGELTLKHVGEEVASHDLVLNNSDASCIEVPLFGSYCCRLAAQPQCMVHDTTTGPLHIQMKSGWKLCWCRLRNLELSCWQSEDDVDDEAPLLVIPVTKDTQVSDIPPSRADRDFSFSISSKKGILSLESVLAADSQGELTRWWDGLQQHFLDQVMWQQACDCKLDIPEPTPDRSSAFVGSSQFFEPNDADSPMTRILNRLNIPEEAEAKARKNKRRSAPPIAFHAELSAIEMEDDSPPLPRMLTPSRSHEDLNESTLETDI